MKARAIATRSAVAVLATGALLAAGTGPALAHGAATAPGSRTYLCYQDANWTGGDLVPRNPACSAATDIGGKQPLWDWFAVLRGDGQGRTEGYIPDGRLCSGGVPKYAGFDLARDDWPVTHLTAGSTFDVHYNAWAAHPGGFRLYVTKDGYDPTRPLAWSDLEPTPFSTWNETAPNGAGEYLWTTSLPRGKSGRHVIYSVWTRTDSQETFYGCSDVVFDGGHGEVTGTGGGTGTTTTTSGGTTTTTGPGGTTTTTTGRTATTTTTGPAACSVDYRVNQWSTGFTAEVSVSSRTARNGWKLTWSFPGDAKVTNSWNANVSLDGGRYTATNAPYNGTIAAGGSQSFGLQGTSAGNNPAPADWALDGVRCSAGGPGGGTTTTTTTAAATSTPAGGTTTTTTTTTTRPATSTTSASSPTGLSEGFESGTLGAGWSVVTKDCSGSGRASVEAGVGHSGSHALRIDGAGGYCNHVFVRAPVNPGALGDTAYVRLFLKHTNPLPQGHVAFLAMNDAAGGDTDLRIGGQNAALQWNRQSDDATLPVQSPAGVGLSRPLPTGSWQCLEYQVSRNGTARTWLDGTPVAGLTADGTPTPDVDQQWLTGAWTPNLTDLRLGWESYSGGDDTLWFDDVRVSPTRVGC